MGKDDAEGDDEEGSCPNEGKRFGADGRNRGHRWMVPPLGSAHNWEAATGADIYPFTTGFWGSRRLGISSMLLCPIDVNFAVITHHQDHCRLDDALLPHGSRINLPWISE